MRNMVLYVEKLLQSAKVVVLPENQYKFQSPSLLEKYDKTVPDGLFKECNVNFDDISSTQLALPAEMGVIRIIISTSRIFGFSFRCE